MRERVSEGVEGGEACYVPLWRGGQCVNRGGGPKWEAIRPAGWWRLVTAVSRSETDNHRGVALVRPPRQYDLHPLEAGQPTREPPAEDTVLTGTLEVVMKERRRVQAISVGVQSVARLNMCGARGWEEDGIFERGVEILSGVDEEGIWLEKGSQR